jgi:hypothetical protein
MEASLVASPLSRQAIAQGVGYDEGKAEREERSLILDIQRFA